VRNQSVVGMGATLDRAECADDKYDPDTERDVYRVAAFFADVHELRAYRAPDQTPTRPPPAADAVSPLVPDGQQLPTRTEATAPRTMRVGKRGDWMDETGEGVWPAGPHCVKPVGAGGSQANRLDLARWLTAPDHPQTARVFVNRLWYLFFGAGLCRSLEDTGSQGEWPTHPELLDWLATAFVESGWEGKHLGRLILTSSAYR